VTSLGNIVKAVLGFPLALIVWLAWRKKGTTTTTRWKGEDGQVSAALVVVAVFASFLYWATWSSGMAPFLQVLVSVVIPLVGGVVVWFVAVTP